MSFGGFDEHNAYAPMSEINTTPLVDVMLVLLIIFMVTAPLLTHSLDINLPRGGGAATEEKSAVITIGVNSAGHLFWNDAPLDEAALPERLAQAARLRPLPELRLRADRDTRYQQILSIMSSARAAGIQKLGFISLPEKGTLNSAP